MPDRANELLARLEQITARAQAIPLDDVESLSAAMEERSAAILELSALLAQTHPEALPEGALERLRRQRTASEALSHKLLLCRAAARAELARVLEAGHVARSLAPGPASSCDVDWQG